MDVPPIDVTSTQNPIIHDTDSVFDRTEPSINFFNQIPREHAKSLSYESVGTHKEIPPLHGESKNATCLSTEVNREMTSVDIRALNDNYSNEITSEANRDIDEIAVATIPDRSVRRNLLPRRVATIARIQLKPWYALAILDRVRLIKTIIIMIGL